MLTKLHVQNYALIDEVQLDLHSGLTIITGETGAGKSILLGALGLLLGERADSSALRDKNKKCIVEGNFVVQHPSFRQALAELDVDVEEETIIRREINAEGKSRAFVNDTPVNLTQLKNLGSWLIDIHSQHETIALNEASYQLNMLDSVADNHALLSDYKQQFKIVKQLTARLQELQALELQGKKDFDYLQFQLDEFLKMQLVPGEEQTIEQELETLENAEEIKLALTRAYSGLDGEESGVLQALNAVKATLSGVAKYNGSIQQLLDRLNSAFIELKDIANELESVNEEIHHDPTRTSLLRERLDDMFRLFKKHGVNTTSDLLRIQSETDAKLQQIGSLEEDIVKASAAMEQAGKKLKQLAQQLHKARAKAIPEFREAIAALLKDLGMPNAVLQIELTELEQLREDGNDKVVFMFNANKGEYPKALSKIASGGELSRLMLSLKSVLAGHTLLPTIIFDEIDTGISGDIAAKAGVILEQLGTRMQVVVITHLPQVASKGQHHLFVYKEDDKDRTVSRIRRLNDKERVEEIAKMLSAGTPGDAARKNARELLKN
ncbi:MAG: DNA repair protein RecN [Bacteroidetes bacterium]|nr:DNA repair protein RecN [Bacteroidota bacterium]